MSTLTGSAEASFATRIRSWVGKHWVSLNWLAVLLLIVFIVDWLTFTAGYAATDDPGTYTWQGWAVLNGQGLAHYTYWYDHPPLGWIQIALYAWVTGGYDRADVGILMASEFMVIAQLVSCALIFAFMRRLKFHRAFAALAVVLFALSPIAVQYQKLAFLDNIAVPWMLAAMVFAVSPRRSLASAFGAGLCMAVSTLSKETSVIWMIPVLYLFWQNHRKGYRTWVFTLLLATYVGAGAFYILYAILKGELVPGPGHVSLIDSMLWQVGRDIAFDALAVWTAFDKLLMYVTLAALPFAFFVRRLRPIALGFTVLAVMVIRGGYIPAPFVICILPFAAMTVAGVIGALWPHREVAFGKVRSWANGRATRIVRMTAVVAMVVALLGFVAPKWQDGIEVAMPRDEVVYYQQTLDYIVNKYDTDTVIAVDDNMWGDLKRRGYKNVVWFYKLDLDPAVQKQYVPDGYKGVEVVALKQIYTEIAKDNANDPIVIQAMKNGRLVAQFGNLERERGVLVDPYDVYEVAK